VPLTDAIDRAAEALARLAPPGPLGVALSGGGDSMALLAAAAGCGGPLRAACVDHGLRPESAAEAALAARRAEALGAPADILCWSGWDRRGNLQAAARAARYELLADWAARHGLVAVALGHTLDDQAETVLLRLLRGSGVDGLSGMAAATRRDGVLWLRPMLSIRRDALRMALSARGIAWIDDPSNDDAAFDRVRARRALASLRDLGIAAEGLAATGARMGRARAALEAQTAALARESVRVDALGAARLARSALQAAPDEIALRLLAAVLAEVTGAPLRPRLVALEALLGAARGGGLGRGRTLHGAVAADDGEMVSICREPAAAAAAPDLDPWDGRWRILSRAPGSVGALGAAGERALASARRAGWRPAAAWIASPRAARLASPALWRDGALVCAPLAGYGEGLVVAPARQAPAVFIE
jgi:tRNA(Ile)-lysidine synthase